MHVCSICKYLMLFWIWSSPMSSAFGDVFTVSPFGSVLSPPLQCYDSFLVGCMAPPIENVQLYTSAPNCWTLVMNTLTGPTLSSRSKTQNLCKILCYSYSNYWVQCTLLVFEECQESNPGHLWLEPPVLCHWATTGYLENHQPSHLGVRDGCQQE